jgi:hypothetical protein
MTINWLFVAFAHVIFQPSDFVSLLLNPLDGLVYYVVSLDQEAHTHVCTFFFWNHIHFSLSSFVKSYQS